MPYPKEQAREYQRQHYLKNRELYRQRAKQWYEDHKERAIKRNVEYNQTPERKERRRLCRKRKSPQFYTEKIRLWRKQNPEKAKINARMYVSRRRARLCNAAGSFTNAEWMQKVAYCGWRCVYCHKELDSDTLTMDHRISLFLGGTNWLSNLVPACQSCNSSKGPLRKTSQLNTDKK